VFMFFDNYMFMFVFGRKCILCKYLTIPNQFASVVLSRERMVRPKRVVFQIHQCNVDSLPKLINFVFSRVISSAHDQLNYRHVVNINP
jgi:hypothetical protein